MSRRRLLTRAGAAILLAVVATVVTVAPAVAASPARAAATNPGRRVLVISVPSLQWSDVTQSAMPNLYGLLAKGAVADLSTRGARQTMRPAESYATIGAGARAVGGDPPGGMFEPAEKWGSDTASDVYARRTGKNPNGSIVAPGIASIISNNDALLFGAKVSALGDALVGAGINRAVVANADENEPPEVLTDTQYGRAAVSALMDSNGLLPRGDVGTDLLQKDPGSPYGVRLDLSRVEAAFAKQFTSRSVVLVEASDLVRADNYRASALSSHRNVLTKRAIRRTDALVGRLLRHVDLRRDSVLVAGVTPSSRQNGDTVTGLVSPGVAPGLLTSATVRRAGFVQLIDVAPTILSLVNVKVPTAMEGRPYERDATGGSFAARRSFLIRSNRAGVFRDTIVRPASVTYGWLQIILSLLAVATVTLALRKLPKAAGRVTAALPWIGLGLIAFVPMTFLAVLLPFYSWGSAAYWTFVAVGSALFAWLAGRFARRNPVDPAIALLGLTYIVIAGDVALNHARLQFNSVFGYSPTAAGRFAGLGNLGFAALAASTVLLAALLAHRIGGRRGRYVAIAVCAVAFLVDGLPMWGADVGGVLAGVPAYAVFITLLLGLRIRWKAVLAWGAATIAAITVLGFIDLARPAAQRTHLGRLFEKIGNQGSGGFSTVILRKAGQNVSTLDSSTWRPMLVVILISLVFMAWRAPQLWRSLERRIPEMRAALIGVATFAVTGYAVNDSGIAIPGMMLGVLNASLVYLVAETRSRRGATAGGALPGTDHEPTPAPGARAEASAVPGTN
ncbi:MAG: hypothetical protein JWL73_822 [Actinomycetia bacterium]|nr:hypothetical protein [Actinomycetes bacterium]